MTHSSLPLFDSRDLTYRAPFGAVTAGTSVYLRVCVPRALQCHACRLLWREDGRLEDRFDMFWAGMCGDGHEWWDCHITPAAPGLYWYGFALDTAQGVRVVLRQPDGRAVLAETDSGARWQMTSYAADFRTPDWLAGGVMYQIFPDRFARSQEAKANVPSDRRMHERWNESPAWRPDETGRIRNNDYFGGDLRGIIQRLDHLKALGVTCLYLNPMFEAHSNHRYDTADYTRIDPLLGTEEDFRELTATAAQLGIRVLLDGVFSHTGADSVYFNKERRYPGEGAYQSLGSPYARWYRFRHWPDDYAAWWGFPTLPEVDEHNPDFLHYICGETGVARRWLKEGASGWRLDVADELPDAFLDALRAAVKAEKPDALLLGEVWEDASNKQSYGHRRRYLLGRQLDSVMNYPFRTAVLEFVRGGSAATFFTRTLEIVEHYPPAVLRILMNPISTHDTERAITLLGGEPANGRGRDWQAAQTLTPEQRAYGLRRMRLAAALQYCLPGVPCLYYGDEAGVEGYRDPFNRATYPWGHEDEELLRWHRKLGQLRRVCPALREGALRQLPPDEAVVCFERRQPLPDGEGDAALLCAVNRADGERTVVLSNAWAGRTVNLGGGRVEGPLLRLPPLECALLLRNDAAE